MSSREPMWFCHECNAEMRPLMAPDPHCASCNGTFVEKMDNSEDDPRNFMQGGDDDRLEAGEMPSLEPVLLGLSQFLGGARPSASGPQNQMPPPHTGNGTGDSFSPFRFQMTSGSGGTTRTFVFGGPTTLGRAPGPQRPGSDGIPGLMRRGSGPGGGAPPTPGEISGPMMAQYLFALLGGMPRRHGAGEDPFGAMFGPESGRMGDFVFSEQALDQIVSELMENSNAHRPVPATDEVTEKLPKEVLVDGSPVLEKDCAVCKEQFSIQAEDPDELVVITLPCKHPFHQSCILPWLKQSGTCPVCRYALVPQPEHHGPAGGNGPSTGPSNNAPGGNQPSSPAPGGQGPAEGGVLSSILGYIRGSQSSNSGGGGSEGSVPGGWTERVD